MLYEVITYNKNIHSVEGEELEKELFEMMDEEFGLVYRNNFV